LVRGTRLTKLHAFAETRLRQNLTTQSAEGAPTVAPIRIIGSYLSPYVRKVLACLELKGLTYQIDPIVPFYGNDEFSRISPLRRIPVLITEEVTISDSTVICEYLEQRFPLPALLPLEAADRARARWLEEFADSRLGEVLIWGLYNQVAIRRAVWNEPPDANLLKKIHEQDIPHVLNYLEQQMPNAGWMFSEFGIADISIATFFRNAEFARFKIDAQQWPLTAAFVARVLAHWSFVRLRTFEDLIFRVPPLGQREVLIAAGAPICPETLAESSPRRGILKI
jgi:glutathione S-transferase